MHYPPEPPGTPSDQYGAAPHTDYGFSRAEAPHDDACASEGVSGRSVSNRRATGCGGPMCPPLPGATMDWQPVNLPGHRQWGTATGRAGFRYGATAGGATRTWTARMYP